EGGGGERMGRYSRRGAPRLKADRSPVTDADEAAEAVILPALATLLPQLPPVSEETAARQGLPEIDRDKPFLLVDPLDGTREFLAGNGEFTVNIALIEARRPVLGVVHLPALGPPYPGGAGGRTMPAGGGAPQAIAARPKRADGLIVLASRSHGSAEELERYLAQEQVARRVAAGSSLKFCRIAEGLADL